MHISKKKRAEIFSKFAGKCAYTGTDLLSDWQVDHVDPVRRNWYMANSAMFEQNHNTENMVPTQRIVNHYKHTYNLEEFRNFMLTFHLRLLKVAKNPKMIHTIKRKAYMLEIARLFDIEVDKPFEGKFYFETL